jgi:hypothetical protein
MKMNQPMFAFVVLLLVHSLVSICAYQFLTTRTQTALPVDPTPVETTTPEQRALGETSFQITTGAGRVTRSVPWVVTFYVSFGYVALALAIAFAIIGRLRTMPT